MALPQMQPKAMLILYMKNHSTVTLLLNLSSRQAATIPAARKNTLIKAAETDVVKLSKGIIITVAAITIPTIA